MDWLTHLIATLGAVGTLYVHKNMATTTDKLTRNRERQLDEARHRRTTLLERSADQRRALGEVQRLAAGASHSLRDEAEFAALRILVTRAYGHPGFADEVCTGLDESAEAVAGTPSENAGLTVIACTEAMRAIIINTDTSANANVPPFEDPMPIVAAAVKRGREVFGNLWATHDG